MNLLEGENVVGFGTLRQHLDKSKQFQRDLHGLDIQPLKTWADFDSYAQRVLFVLLKAQNSYFFDLPK